MTVDRWLVALYRVLSVEVNAEQECFGVFFDDATVKEKGGLRCLPIYEGESSELSVQLARYYGDSGAFPITHLMKLGSSETMHAASIDQCPPFKLGLV